MALVGTGEFTIVDLNDGPVLQIFQSAGGFTYLDDVATPANQVIAFSIIRHGIGNNDAVWTTSDPNVTLLTNDQAIDMGLYIFGLPGAGEGDTVYLTLSEFGTNSYLSVWATVDGYTANATVLRISETSAQPGATRNVFVGDWTSGYNYVVGDIVLKDGYGWSCVQAHTSSGVLTPPTYPTTSNAYWSLYTVKGDTSTTVRVSGEQAFKFLANEISPVSNNITLSAALTGSLTTYDWQYWNGSTWVDLSGSNISPTYTLAYNNAAWGSSTSLRIRCVSNASAGSPYDEITINKLYDGSNPVTGYLTNENHSVPTDATGSPSTYGLQTAGGTFIVYRGTSPVTNGIAFSTSPAQGGTSYTTGSYYKMRQNGLVFAIHSSTGVYDLSTSPTWTSRSETFNVKATYGGTTIEKIYTISKAGQGSPGVDGSPGLDGTGFALNPGFEQGWAGWIQDSGTTIIESSPAVARSGTWVAKGTSAFTLSNNNTFYASQTDHFIIDGWIKTTPGAVFSAAGWEISFWSSLGSYLGSISATTSTPTTNWVQLSARGSAPSGTYYGKVRAIVSSITSGIVYWDDVEVIRTISDTPRFTMTSTEKLEILTSRTDASGHYHPKLETAEEHKYRWVSGGTTYYQGVNYLKTNSGSPDLAWNEPFQRSYITISDIDGIPLKTFQFDTLAKYNNSAGSIVYDKLLTVFADSYYAPYIGVNKRAVRLTANKDWIHYWDGFDVSYWPRIAATSSPALTLYASPLNTSPGATLYYEFINRTTGVVLSNSTSPYWSYNPSPATGVDSESAIWHWSSATNNIEVVLREGSPAAPALASDSYKINSFPGVLGMKVATVITNPTPTVTFDIAGSPNYTFTTTDIKAQYGIGNNGYMAYSSTLDANGTFRVTNVSYYGISPGTATIVNTMLPNGSPDTYRLAKYNDMTADVAKVVFTVETKDTGGTTTTNYITQIIGKSIEGYTPFPDNNFNVSIGNNTSLKFPTKEVDSVIHAGQPGIRYCIRIIPAGNYVESSKHDITVTHLPSNTQATTTVELKPSATTSNSTTTTTNYSGIYGAGSVGYSSGGGGDYGGGGGGGMK